MDKKMNKDLGGTGGNLDRENVRTNIGKSTDKSFGNVGKKGVDKDINR
ncbi:MAG: hypothetical protein ACAI44_24185 [Candidatus Sericytochromatia bacterium]